MNKRSFVYRKAAGRSLVALSLLTALSIVVSSISQYLGFVSLSGSRPQSIDHNLFIKILLSNLIVAFLFYILGYIRDHVLFYALLFLNLCTWALYYSLIIPWAAHTHSWSASIWLFSYIFLEIYAYFLANLLGRIQCLNIIPVLAMLLLSAWLEVIGMENVVVFAAN